MAMDIASNSRSLGSSGVANLGQGAPAQRLRTDRDGDVDTRAAGAGSGVGVQVSPFGSILQQLQSLGQSDPDKLKSLFSQLGEQLKAAASQISGPAGQFLSRLADQFAQVGQTGDLSGLQLAPGAAPSPAATGASAPTPPAVAGVAKYAQTASSATTTELELHLSIRFTSIQFTSIQTSSTSGSGVATAPDAAGAAGLQSQPAPQSSAQQLAHGRHRADHDGDEGGAKSGASGNPLAQVRAVLQQVFAQLQKALLDAINGTGAAAQTPAATTPPASSPQTGSTTDSSTAAATSVTA